MTAQPTGDANPGAPNGANAGGAANAGGVTYQATLATYLAAVILAEQRHQLNEAFPRGVPLRIGAEQGWPIDDLALFTERAIAWMQAKRTLHRQDLRDALAQFIRQSAHGRGRAGTFEPLLDDDRFIIACDHGTDWILQQLPGLLDRLRHGESLGEITQNAPAAQRAYDDLVADVRAIAPDISDDVLAALLRRMHLYHVTSAALGQLTRAALAHVVADDDVRKAEGVLALGLAPVPERRTLRNRVALRTVLLDADFTLLSSTRARPDVDRLNAYTDRTINAERQPHIVGAGLHLDRPVTTALLDALNHGNVVLTGEGGSGKTVVMLDAAEHLRNAGATVVFLNAESPLPVLEREIEEVLLAWAEPGRTAYLFIDGMDGLRLGPEVRRMHRLIASLAGAPWRVAIASRSYDLEHSPRLAALFPPIAVPAAYIDPRFTDVGHLQLGELGDADLAWFRAHDPALDTLLATAAPHLIDLVRNPFNLSIAMSLAGTVDLATVRTRDDLLRRWWDHRIRDGGGLAREAVLRTLVRAMIAQRRTRVATEFLEPGDPANDLLSKSVLMQRTDGEETIAFRHAVILDYAIERLLLAHDGGPLEVLGDDRDAFVFMLPSLRAHFQALYHDPAHFMRELRALFADQRQRATLLLILAGIPVERFANVDDVAPLVADDDLSVRAFRAFVRTAIRMRQSGRPLVGPDAGPWSLLALRAAQHLPLSFHESALLLNECLADGTPTPEQRTALGETARRLLAYHLDADDTAFAWRNRLVVGGFTQTYDTDPARALPLLERLVAAERIQRLGPLEVQTIGFAVKDLHDARGLETLYARVFADLTVADEQQALGQPSVGLNLTMGQSQMLDMARWRLADRFAGYVREHPAAATRSLCLVVEATRWAQGHGRAARLRFGDVTCTLRRDASNVWDQPGMHEHDSWHIMAVALEAFLGDELRAGRTEVFFTVLAQIIAHGRNLYFWRVLIRTAALHPDTAHAFVPFIAQRDVLLLMELQGPISTFLTDRFATLSADDRALLETALLSLETDETDDERRDARTLLLEKYVASLPPEVDTPLAARRAIDAPQQRDNFFGGFRMEAGTIDPGRLSEDAAEHGASDELQQAIDAAEPFIHHQSHHGDPATIAPTARRILAAAADAPAELAAAALDVVAEVILAGLARNAFSADELNEFEPTALRAATTALAGFSEAEDEAHSIRWGAPSATIAGTQALPYFFARTGHAEVAETLLGLTTHPRANVRFHALTGVMRLGENHLPEIWAALEHALDDPNLAIVHTAAERIERLAQYDADRAQRGLFRAYDRFVTAPRTEYSIEQARNIVAWTFAGVPGAAERLAALLEDPWTTPEFAHVATFELTNQLAPENPHAGAAVALLVPYLERLSNRWQQLIAEHGENVSAFPPPARSQAETSIKLATEVAERTYYTAGTMVHMPGGGFEDSGTIGPEHLARIRPLLAALASTPLPHTTYYVVKTLVGAIGTDPLGVLRLGTDAMLLGATVGLPNDGFAEGDIRQFLMQYVTRHRALLEANRDALTRVMDVTDAFAAAGWPQWIDVAFELDAIYRE